MAEGRVTVTISVFSGRPNPTWQLTPNQVTELDSRLRQRRAQTLSKPPGASYGLGYRGLLVDWQRPGDGGSLHVHGGIAGTSDLHANHEDSNRELERWLLSTLSVPLEPDVLAHINADLAGPTRPVMARAGAGCPPCGGGAAPAYNPAAWNNPVVQPYNNCYNYATNTITNTFAQPGTGSGHPFAPPPDCANVTAAAQHDGLVSVPSFAPAVAGAYYVALVIWPGVDFHWYRQDSSGCWSHKPGSTPVRDTDSAGQPITDPQHCARGPYVTFCGYMTVAPGHITIG